MIEVLEIKTLEEETIRYGHLKAWSGELGINIKTLRKRLMNIIGIEGVIKGGHRVMAYAEHDVRKACFDLIQKKQNFSELNSFRIAIFFVFNVLLAVKLFKSVFSKIGVSSKFSSAAGSEISVLFKSDPAII